MSNIWTGFGSGMAALCASAAVAIGAWPGNAAAQDAGGPVDPAAFTSDIAGNPLFSLPIGKKMVYSAQTGDGVERIEILVPGWTRTVMGVETLVYWDRVFLNGQLVEDTRDYLAQHENGDIWYFGEDVDNYEDGVLVDHDGAWTGGVDGAEPGIWMLAAPKAGDKYRQEFYAGKAEDAAEILSSDEAVTTTLGQFADCTKILEWSPLFTATAHKFYCTQIGAMTLEVDLAGPDVPNETRTELVEIDMSGALGIPVPQAYAAEGVVPIASAGDDRDDGGDDDDDDEEEDDSEDK